MKLNDDAKKWHRLWSVRLAILSAVFGAIEISLPLWQEHVPGKVFAVLATVTAAASAAARVIRQELSS